MVSINRQVILLLLFMLVVITLVSCWTGRRLDGLPDGASSIIVPLTKEETPFKDALGPTAHIGSVKPKYHVQPVQISLPFFDHPSAELLPRIRASYWTPYCWFPIAQPIEIRGGSNPMAVVRSHHFGGYANWGVTEFKADSGAWCLRLMPRPGLDITEPAKTASRILVLVHGEWTDPAFWNQLLKNMAGKLPNDIAVVHMHWPQGDRIADSGKLFLSELNRLAAINPSAEVHIVSHSIGGLVARYALESKPRPEAKVVSLTMFAPPNQGSGWARVRSDDAGGTRTVIEDLMMKYDRPEISLRETLASLYMFKDGTGAAMEDLDPKSDFLANLNRDWKGPPEGVEYRIIAGLALSYWNMLHEKSYFEDEMLDEIRGDWIVSEKSAALPGMAPILLPYPHFRIQNTVEAAVEILRTIGVAAKF